MYTLHPSPSNDAPMTGSYYDGNNVKVKQHIFRRPCGDHIHITIDDNIRLNSSVE